MKIFTYFEITDKAKEKNEKRRTSISSWEMELKYKQFLSN